MDTSLNVFGSLLQTLFKVYSPSLWKVFFGVQVLLFENISSQNQIVAFTQIIGFQSFPRCEKWNETFNNIIIQSKTIHKLSFHVKNTADCLQNVNVFENTTSSVTIFNYVILRNPGEKRRYWLRRPKRA